MSDRHSQEIGGTIGGMAGALAVAGPGAVFGSAIVLTLGALALYVGAMAWRTMDSWLPFLVVGLSLAGIWLAHVKLWVPHMRMRWARSLTALLVLAVLAVIEGGTGGLGLAIGRATGVNPEEVLYRDFGVPLPDSMVSAFESDRRLREEKAACAVSKAAGKPFDGTDEGLNMTYYCANQMTADERRRACLKYLESHERWPDMFSAAVCQRAGVQEPRKPRR